MSLDIKLKVFTISLKKLNAKKNKDLLWSEAFDKCIGKNQEEKFNSLFKSYIESFDGQFIRYKNWPKAICIPNNDLNLTFKSKDRIFHAVFEGGNTNQTFTIKELTYTEDGLVVNQNQVTAQPFNLIFYLPHNSNVGLLIVQGLGETSMHDILKLNFNIFIRSLDDTFNVDYSETIPKEAVERYQKGNIKSISIRQRGLPKEAGDTIFTKEYTDYSGINIELKLSFADKVKNATLLTDFKKIALGKDPELFNIEELKDLGVTTDSEVFVKFEYNKRETTAKLEDGFKFTPSYIIDSVDVPLTADNRPDPVKLKKYMFTFLNKITKEIGLKS